jgi:hypothetical protein
LSLRTCVGLPHRARRFAHLIRQSLLRGHVGFCIRLQGTAAPTASTQLEERLA